MQKKSRKKNKILVTAALPYANGKIHLGHIAGAYLPADIYVRYQRSKKREVVFICGSDEHGVPITITAEQEKTSPQIIVDRYHTLNEAAFELLGIQFDNYSRTSLPIHHQTAQDFFLQLHENHVLTEKKEQQLYDEQAAMFLPDRYVEGTCPVCSNPQARGDQCENCGTFLNPTELIHPKSKITGTTPSVRETTHWYFPLGKFQKDLEKYVASADRKYGWKENVLQYCRSWFKEGLQDRAVTRDLEWGVRVPLKEYADKVLYVWFEAVLGYVSSTKEWAQKTGKPNRWKDYWLDKSTTYIAFIGKDNIVFHCIVFPAMLMAWNKHSKLKYILPANVPANEFLNFEGQKFSKSRGWGIDVDDFLEQFPPDPLRYALAVNLPETRDADFYWKDFQARNNNELADIVGNFVNRTLTFVHKNFGGKVPPREQFSSRDKDFVNVLKTAPRTISEMFERYRFREGTTEVVNLARAANKYFNDSEPWKTLKENPGQCATTLNLCLQTVRSLAIVAEPFLPFSARRLWQMLRLPGNVSDDGWDSAGELRLPAGHRLGKPEILFTKIEDDVIEKQIAKLPASDTPARGTTDMISIEDFKRVELRVGKVLACEKIPKSEKLLRVQVSLGAEQRQVIAGIAQQYSPESLVGKKVVLVSNLQPARLMGEESRGMLLAASDNNGKLSVITLDGDIAEGSVVK
jgi:methionyl-tRNA synthetase